MIRVKILATALGLLITGTASAQNFELGTDVLPQNIIMVVDSFLVNPHQAIINPGKIDSISVLKGPEAIRRFGSIASNGAIIIYSRKNTNYLRLDGLLDHFIIAPSSRTLPVCIDGSLVSDTRLLLFDLSAVKSAVITMGNYQVPGEQIPREGSFIDISTKRP